MHFINVHGDFREGFDSKCLIISTRIKAAAEQEGFKSTYNKERKSVIVLDSHSLPSKTLLDRLYVPELTRVYQTLRFYPVTEEERDLDGNLEVKIFNSMIATPDETKAVFSKIPVLLNKNPLTPNSPVSDCKSVLVSPTIEETAEMEKCIASNLIDIMNQFLNKYEGEKGIWYPNDFQAYLKTNHGKEMEESFYSGFANEDFFEKTDSWTFALKNGKIPSEALLSFLSGPTVTDCGCALTACYEECLRRIIGDEKYNALRSKHFVLAPIGIANPKSSISKFCSSIETTEKENQGILGKRPLKPGEECGFKGVPGYLLKHPTGPGRGWNVIYIGDDLEGRQLFMAHGFEKPLTEVEIYKRLIELYNGERTVQDEEYIARKESAEQYDRNQNPILRDLYTIPVEEAEKDPCQFVTGFRSRSVQWLRASDCITLKKLTLPECLVFMNKKEGELLMSCLKALCL